VPISVAGKTGTAENTSGDDHSWFVAFAPAENPQIAVAVVLENVGHGDGAITAAREVMKSYLENN
jgi:cell division protein FtsI/penicillin-binding protein 2